MSPARRVLTTLAIAAATAGAVAPSPAQADAVSDDAVAWGLSQVGHRETGTGNCSPRINRWQSEMGLKVPPCRPWCGSFVHQAFRQAGITLSSRLVYPARTEQDAKAGKRGLFAIAKSDVRPGDLLFFALHAGDPRASHLAIVTSSPSGGKVRTVEGNIGHMVRTKVRGLKFAVLAARVRR